MRSSALDSVHVPVLLEEVMGLFSPGSGTYVDATVGLGGHAFELLRRGGEGLRLIGIDRDPEALQIAQERLLEFGDRVRLVHAEFDRLDEVLDALNVEEVQGVLFDLGMSSYQLERSGRGFSFLSDEPLDMRMNPETGLTAADVVNHWRVEELEACLRTYGEERFARRIARAVERARRRRPIRTARELAELVSQAVPRRRSRLHPATRVFQALRIVVNDELGQLERALPQAIRRLAPGGVCAVIAFHSLEDRRVKRFFRELAGSSDSLPEPLRSRTFELLTKRPIVPTEEEIAQNPRARSAKLRALRRRA
ncbi:MAG: ribosomal RNA small subunit methyltransferase H [Candidatus Poribacteria bacterium]|nr:MAG: ribosomal RNA small subunit methyltransferase H [Candidatus Poribacteria bacterium]